MQALIDFLKGIASAITGAIDFLFGVIKDLVYIVQLLAEFTLQIPSYLSWLPNGIVAIFVTTFAVVVIYKVLGREG